jgi:hypothetical protein
VVSAAALVVLALVGVILYPRLTADKRPKTAQTRPEPMVPDPRPAPMEVVRIAPDGDRKPAKVLLEIKVVPDSAKATILFRGKEYRQNALELLVMPANTTEVVRVEAAGFHSLTRHITVSGRAKLKHVLPLKRKAGMVTRPWRPRPRMGPDDDLKTLPGD